MNKKNIILIGFMGCGKTSIGNELASILNLSFVDVDKFIEDKHSCSISDIFLEKGEDFFRNEEAKAIESLSQNTGYVIATGGGAILNKNNITNLKSNGVVIYLKANINHIFNNVKEDTNRPLLQTDNPYETIKILFERRKQLYLDAADMIIDVTDNSISEIVENIIYELHKEEV